ATRSTVGRPVAAMATCPLPGVGSLTGRPDGTRGNGPHRRCRIAVRGDGHGHCHGGPRHGPSTTTTGAENSEVSPGVPVPPPVVRRIAVAVSSSPTLAVRPAGGVSVSVTVPPLTEPPPVTVAGLPAPSVVTSAVPRKKWP